MLKKGCLANEETLDVTVPTGNFGNILAAYYAKQMGVPIGRLICASNENKVLYDFFATGTYDRNREFILTSSPSMDILISSNLERLVYRIAGDSEEKNRELMRELSAGGTYTVTDEMREKLSDFYGGYATEEETARTIRNIYKKTGYVLDTHTAVAACVCQKYRDEKGNNTKNMVISTASPFKFTRSVMTAIDPIHEKLTDFEMIDELSRIAGVKVPQAIEEIRTAPVRHTTVAEAGRMAEAVEAFLGI